MKLVKAHPGLESSLISWAEEHFRVDGGKAFRAIWQDPGKYLRVVDLQEKGEAPRPGFVAQTTFFLLENDLILGRSRLRHEITPALEIEGGHIGYDIRPGQRKKGRGTQLLALTLVKAARLGLKRVMVTCDFDNIGSKKIIEKNGGVFNKETISPRSGKRILTYWIAI